MPPISSALSPIRSVTLDRTWALFLKASQTNALCAWLWKWVSGKSLISPGRQDTEVPMPPACHLPSFLVTVLLKLALNLLILIRCMHTHSYPLILKLRPTEQVSQQAHLIHWSFLNTRHFPNHTMSLGSRLAYTVEVLEASSSIQFNMRTVA